MMMEPAAWEAMTGTAGKADGCDRPFWLKDDAVAYVREHGGYVRPLYALPDALGAYEIARAISESLGEDPDMPAPRSVMCTHDNGHVPYWMVHEEQAKAVLRLFRGDGTPSA